MIDKILSAPDKTATASLIQGFKSVVLPFKKPPQAAGLAPARPGAGEALGIPTVITDYKARSEAIQVVDSYGEIAFFDPASSRSFYDAEAEKNQRWLMLRQAQNILRHGDGAFELRGKWDLVPYSVLLPFNCFGPVQQRHSRTERPTVARDGSMVQLEALQPRFRTVLCLQRHVSGRDASVWRAKATGSCNWHDVTVCGSPWTCPLCSIRISRVRQDHIRSVYDGLASVGGSSYMLTFTVRHGYGDDCGELVGRMKSAMQFFQKTQEFKSVTRKKPLLRRRADSLPFLGYIGRIAALEVTHGANGWHPHEHHLWFFQRPLTRAALAAVRNLLFAAWRACCLAVGLPAPLAAHGLDIRIALSAAEYIAKFGDLGLSRRWGPEKEIASSHTKTGRAKGRSPMQILADSLGPPVQSAADSGDFVMTRDCHLFLDFANAFLGRHQLQISRTLKSWLRAMGVDIDAIDDSDEDIAHSLESDSVLQFELSASDFRCVVRNKAQGVVLQVCQFGGVAAALDFVRSLPGWFDYSADSAWQNDPLIVFSGVSYTPVLQPIRLLSAQMTDYFKASRGY